MKKTTGSLARGIAFLLALLLVFALPLSILAFDLGRVVFNPPLMKTVLTDTVTESDLIAVVLEWYSSRRAEQRYAGGEAAAWVGEPDVVQLMDFMIVNDWLKLRQIALPDQILAEWVSATVDGTYAWIDSDERVPQITWAMKPFIDHVNGDPGLQSISIAYAALPDCVPDQIADFQARLAAAPLGTEVLYNLCEFPDPWYEDQFGDYLAALQGLINNIPLQFALTWELAQVDDTAGVGPETLKSQLRLIRLWMQLAPLIPIVLLVLIVAFVVRSLKSLGRWTGVPIVAGGLIALILALVHRALITALVSSGVMSEVPALVRAEALAGILRLAEHVFAPMLWQSIVVLLLGGVLLFFGYFYQKAAKPEVVDVE